MNYCMTDCRVCLKSGIIPIFGNDRKPDISHEIETFGYICVKKDDNYPQFICEQCLKLLQGAILFRKTAKRSNNILKSRVRGKNLKSVFEVSCIDGDNYSADGYDAKESQSKVPVKKEGVTPLAIKVEVFTNSEKEEDNVSSDNDYTIEIPITFNTGTGQTDQKKIFEEHLTTQTDKKCNFSSLTKGKGNVKKSNEEKIKNSCPKDYTCNICCKSFSRIYYPKHMKKLHDIIVDKPMLVDINKEECPECKKLFAPGRLRRHMKFIHDKIQPLIKVECPTCKKMISKDFFPIHEKRHKEGKKRNLVCEQCGKNFHFHSSLSMHKITHRTELPFKCSYCPYKGRTKDVLKIHVRTHTKEYPYVCAECGIGCINKSNLNVHMKRHRGPIDFKCDRCPRGFYNKLELERHITVAHEGVKSHICADCGAAFGYSRGLRKHQVKVHKRPKGLGKPRAVYLKMEEESAKDANTEV